MTHRKDLMKKGFISYAKGDKNRLKLLAKMLKDNDEIRNHRIVNLYDDSKGYDEYELYVRGG